MEKWQKIPSMPRYEVSNTGKVRSTSFGKHGVTRIMKLKHHKQGYFEVGLYDMPKLEGGKQRWFLVHALILEAFKGAPGEGQVCRHLNGNPANNHLDNLMWGTPSENWLDARAHGTEASCKLSDSQVLEIRSTFIGGRQGNARKLAQKFGVHTRTITQCVARRSYAWVCQ